MEKYQFKTTINASREKVWDILWADATYRQWTTPFMDGSHAVTDWKKGSKILFLGPEGSGMVSRIHESIPNEFMSFQHLGEVHNGVEDTESEKVKQWAGAFENYTLKTVDNQTELVIDMDINAEYAEMFSAMWPKALALVKEIAEKD